MAEHLSAYLSSLASVSRVAARVIARTFAYDSRPTFISADVSGRSSSACATRTFSRQVPIMRPVLQASHSAHDVNASAQPSRRSNSAIRVSIS